MQAVKHAIDHSMIEVLWANDQLNSQRKKGKVLQGFQVRHRTQCQPHTGA